VSRSSESGSRSRPPPRGQRSGSGRLGALVQTPALDGSRAIVEAELPAARVQDLQRQLPALTSGESVIESDFAGYRPVAGERPVRSGAKMV
jgi:ribosomal protection tetracycline resistance protein